MSRSLLQKIYSTQPCEHLESVRDTLAEAAAKTAEIEAIFAKPQDLIGEAEQAFQKFIKTQEVKDFERFHSLRREAIALDSSVSQLRIAVGALTPFALRDCGPKAVKALSVAIARISEQITALDAPERATALSLNLDFIPSHNVVRLNEFKQRLIDEMNAFRNEPSDRHPGRLRQLANLLPL